MLTAIEGYYDGSRIVLTGNHALQKGQKVVVTAEVIDASAKTPTDLSVFMGRGKKIFEGDAAEYVKELRKDD
ncbi:MAG: hypothetical protein IJL92_04320 [Thermoguttaceae bacterium]|nr:hypothetical protein [Thermoguttaceae bacterium]